jgi:N-glycosylase/DNA lyase
LHVRDTEDPGRLALTVVSAAPHQAGHLAAARAVTHAVLALDHDLEPFYRLTDTDPAFSWVRPAGAGRLLRAPTVFEDLVKLICTTNCNWSATRRMVGHLIAALGPVAATGRRAFPTPERMAAEPESFYQDVVRAGYRARALREIAERAAREPSALESLRAIASPSAALRRALLDLRGVGPYAAENLLRLLGRHDFLAIDSWSLVKFARIRNRRRPSTPQALARAYRRFGPYQGLAMWLDLTRDWPCYPGT